MTTTDIFLWTAGKTNMLWILILIHEMGAYHYNK